MEIVNRHIDDLIFAEYNPRQLSEKDHKSLTDSIKRFGLVDPLIVNVHPERTNILVGGHQRVRIAKELGFTEVPTVEVNLTYDKEKELNIRLNKNNGQWDFDMLANHFDVEDLTDWGFDLSELNFSSEEPVEEEEPEFIPDKEPVTVLGDLYELNEHRLHCANSIDSEAIARLMNGKKADMVFTDPDYSMDIQSVIDCYNNCKIFSSFQLWMTGDKQMIDLVSNDRESFTHFFVQNFKMATMISGSQPMQRHTLIAKFGNRKMNNLKDGFTTILDIATERLLKTHKEIPMSKRPELPKSFIEHYMQKGEIILDIFSHSGSTLIASEMCGVIAYLQELEPKYCDYTITRFIKYMNENGRKYTIKKNGTILSEKSLIPFISH